MKSTDGKFMPEREQKCFSFGARGKDVRVDVTTGNFVQQVSGNVNPFVPPPGAASIGLIHPEDLQSFTIQLALAECRTGHCSAMTTGVCVMQLGKVSSAELFYKYRISGSDHSLTQPGFRAS